MAYSVFFEYSRRKNCLSKDRNAYNESLVGSYILLEQVVPTKPLIKPSLRKGKIVIPQKQKAKISCNFCKTLPRDSASPDHNCMTTVLYCTHTHKHPSQTINTHPSHFSIKALRELLSPEFNLVELELKAKDLREDGREG